MAHSLPLITTIAIALSSAFILGFIAVKLRLPTIVGYLLAGILIGPFTPGVVANAQIAAELAEIGVMLLMFGVGLEFSFEQLLAVRKIALPGALIQIAVATCLGGFIATSWGWHLGGALIFGLSLSVASTVVLLRALESQGLLHSLDGQIAVGWLVVEDLAMVIVLVLLPSLASWMHGSVLTQNDQRVWVSLSLTILKASTFIGIMLFIGRRYFPKVLLQIDQTGSRELFTLCVIAAAISIAFAASRFFGMSFALGAFFAGIIMRESRFSARVADESLPFRDAFAVLFFVSVGMLFDPLIFIKHPLEIIAVVAIIIVGKSIAAFLLVLAFRYPLHSALYISASLAQIGEFSFILAGLGVSLKLLPPEGQKQILGGALISIALNPLVFRVIKFLQTRVLFASTVKQQERGGTLIPLVVEEMLTSDHLILVGYGKIGESIATRLSQYPIPLVIIEKRDECRTQLTKTGMNSVLGNAARELTLIKAGIENASMLVITISNIECITQITKTVRLLNAKVKIFVTVNTVEQAKVLENDMIKCFYPSPKELAKSMSQSILEEFGLILQ